MACCWSPCKSGQAAQHKGGCGKRTQLLTVVPAGGYDDEWLSATSSGGIIPAACSVSFVDDGQMLVQEPRRYGADVSFDASSQVQKFDDELDQVRENVCLKIERCYEMKF